MSDRGSSLAGEFLRILREMPVLPPVPELCDWIRAQEIPIKSENTTYQGQFYDPDRFPVVSRLVSSFLADTTAKELHLHKPVQTSATTIVAFGVAWNLAFQGGNAIFAMHDRDASRDKAKDEIFRLIRLIDALGKAEAEAENETTAGAMRFPNGIIYVGSGGSKSVFTSIPAYIVVLDEAELHPVIDGATSTERGRERLTGAADGGKLIAMSKPEVEAVMVQDPRTRKWSIEPKAGAHVHASYLSGNQLRYECPCPKCGTFFEPKFTHLRFDHCNEALPGLAPVYNFEWIEEEIYLKCPHCEDGKIHEGPEKHAFVRAGEWRATPTAERKGVQLYARPVPGRWSARFSALTDIAFPDKLSWGKIATEFIEAQGHPAALRAWRNGRMGEPEPEAVSEDTTMAHLRKLIAVKGKSICPNWRMRDENGDLTRFIPIPSCQTRFIAVCCDHQHTTLKYTTRAHGKDGQTYLLDYGAFAASPEYPELVNYIDTMRFEHFGGGDRGILISYVDAGYNFSDVLLLSLAHKRIEAVRGEGMDSRYRGDGMIWPSKWNKKGGGIIPYWTSAANAWEKRLYVDCIQKFDPLRYRHWAPALWCPEDVGDDYFVELMQMHEVFERGKNRWAKVSRDAKNDWGDCEKMHLMLDWNSRLAALLKKTLPAGKQGEEPPKPKRPQRTKIC